MKFELPTYNHPDFNQSFFKEAPNVKLVEVLEDGISPKIITHYQSIQNILKSMISGFLLLKVEWTQFVL